MKEWKEIAKTHDISHCAIWTKCLKPHVIKKKKKKKKKKMNFKKKKKKKKKKKMNFQIKLKLS